MSRPETRCFIGIGTNLGDRSANIRQALSEMESRNIRIRRLSSVESTEPVEVTDQPRFLNCIAEVFTVLLPHELQSTLLDIETGMGRVRSRSKGPRIIDLDILLYGDSVIHTDRLDIPHPGILNRCFILKHLVELDPDLKDPESGRAYIEAYRSY